MKASRANVNNFGSVFWQMQVARQLPPIKISIDNDTSKIGSFRNLANGDVGEDGFWIGAALVGIALTASLV